MFLFLVSNTTRTEIIKRFYPLFPSLNKGSVIGYREGWLFTGQLMLLLLFLLCLLVVVVCCFCRQLFAVCRCCCFCCFVLDVHCCCCYCLITTRFTAILKQLYSEKLSIKLTKLRSNYSLASIKIISSTLSFGLDKSPCKTNPCGRNEWCSVTTVKAGKRECICNDSFIRRNGNCVPKIGKFAYFWTELLQIKAI